MRQAIFMLFKVRRGSDRGCKKDGIGTLEEPDAETIRAMPPGGSEEVTRAEAPGITFTILSCLAFRTW
jgi:hypothetical protein